MTANDEKIKALSEREAKKLLDTEEHRQRINVIITEYVNNVDFMKKVREYAGMEIDSRMFRSVQYWATLIISSIVTSGIGVYIGHVTK